MVICIWYQNIIISALNQFLSIVLTHSNHVLKLLLPSDHLIVHDSQVASIQIPWKCPIDMHHLLNFIYSTFNQIERHGFHDQELNVDSLDFADLSYLQKWNGPFIFAALKNHL